MKIKKPSLHQQPQEDTKRTDSSKPHYDPGLIDRAVIAHILRAMQRPLALALLVSTDAMLYMDCHTSFCFYPDNIFDSS